MELWLARLRQLRSAVQTRVFGLALIVLVAVTGFLNLAEEVGETRLVTLDRQVLQLVRTHIIGDPSSEVADVALNLTALGGYPVITLLMGIVTVFLLARGARLEALYLLAAVGGGAALSTWLKAIFVRERPSVVEPVIAAAGWSFPSGHALASAVVYLTLGGILATNVQGRRMKALVLAMALMVTGIVGVTRVLLSVHYPSDVLAGWMAGLAWALCCWLVYELLARRRGAGDAIDQPREGQPG